MAMTLFFYIHVLRTQFWEVVMLRVINEVRLWLF